MKEINVVLGVTGGIAAYKACDLASRLKKQAIGVDVIMTQAATQFVSPLTFQSLVHRPVVTDMFERPSSMEIEHISLAKKADVFVIAPATANIIGKIANGIADDMLSTTVMATEAPVLIAPAMNTKMYENPIVQANIQKLKDLGYHFIEPESGLLACDDIGKGKLAPPEEILKHILMLLYTKKDFVGKNVLITAGPTREPLDPVRFITNFSTGKMGYALAEIAALRGAHVTVIAGPTQVSPPKGVHHIPVTTALEMHEAVMARIDDQDVFIATAAVADYRPMHVSSQKIKKKEGPLSIEMTRNPDIAWSVGQNKKDVYTVGFSVETENVIENARGKLLKKAFDLICVNDVTVPGAGFGGDTNLVTLIDKSGEMKALEMMSKHNVAEAILDHVALTINK